MLRAEDKSAEAPKSPILNSGHTYEELNSLPGHSQAAWPPQNLSKYVTYSASEVVRCLGLPIVPTAPAFDASPVVVLPSGQNAVIADKLGEVVGLLREAQQSDNAVGGWPALLSQKQLCAYVGVGPITLMKICPVSPVQLGIRCKRWRRTEIDVWLETLPTQTLRERSSASEAGLVDLSDDMEVSAVARREEALRRIKKRNEKGGRR